MVAAADKPLDRAKCTPEEKNGSMNATWREEDQPVNYHIQLL
jgi:hypothetical protein